MVTTMVPSGMELSTHKQSTVYISFHAVPLMLGLLFFSVPPAASLTTPPCYSLTSLTTIPLNITLYNTIFSHIDPDPRKILWWLYP